MIALTRADYFDLENEWFLLMNLRWPQGLTKPESEGSDQRREGVKLWLHAFHRLETEKDKNFDPHDLPALHVQPPRGANIIAGMSSIAIKDPTLRAEYERSINENKKKLAYFNNQLRLRQNEEFIIASGVKYISKMYQLLPASVPELAQLLAEFDISTDLRKHIGIEVQKGLSHE